MSKEAFLRARTPAVLWAEYALTLTPTALKMVTPKEKQTKINELMANEKSMMI